MTPDDLGTAVRDLIEDGTPPPCHGRDEWISEDAAEREAAPWQCAPCPVIAACHDAAERNREKFGVWAGIDRSVIR